MQKLGFNQVNATFFDTLKVEIDDKDKKTLKKLAEHVKINFRYFESNHIGISLDETKGHKDVLDVLEIFSELSNKNLEIDLDSLENYNHEENQNLIRKSTFLEHEVFNKYQTEHEILRYMKRLENKDLSLVHSMISLGSCTMKLNSTTEMIPVTGKR